MAKLNGDSTPIITDANTGLTIFRADGNNQIVVGNGTTATFPTTAAIRGGGEGNISEFQCLNYTYSIGAPEVVKTNKLITPSQSPSNFPDHTNLLLAAKECVLIAPVYECCWIDNPNGPLGSKITNGSTKIGYIELARPKILLSYEYCEVNGQKGKKAVLVKYFDLEDIINGSNLTGIAGPDRNPNNPLSAFSLGISPSSPIWGNCFGGPIGGTPPTDYWTNYISQNQGILTGLQNIGQVKFSSGIPGVDDYFLIDPNTGGTAAGVFGILADYDCQENGECKSITTTPPAGPPSVECIGSTVVTPRTPQEWLNYAREHFGRISFIDTQLRDSSGNIRQISRITDERQVGLVNNGEIVDLESYGFPCRIGQIARYQIVSYTTYPEFTFCQLTNGSTRLVFTGRIIEDRSNPVFDGPITDKPIGVTQFNPSCCDRLKTAYTTGDQVSLNALSSIGLRAQHIERTKIYELVDSCSCEEVEIADLGCFFDNVNYSTILKADVKDLRTHTGVRRQAVDERCKSDGPTVYHPFDRRRDIINNRTKSGTQGLFGGDDTMDCYFTSSTKPTSSNSYYYEVTDCETCGKIPYFAVTYGHISGSGSVFIDNEDSNKTATDSIYSQYQLMCLEPNRTTTDGILIPKFSFVSQSVSVNSDDIYVINFNRNGIKDRLDAGNFQINLSELSGSSYTNNAHTGSNVKVGSTKVMNLIDDSDDFDQFETCEGDPLTSYNIVSGTLASGKYEASSVNTYGKVYPNLGIIVLHPKRLNESMGFNTVTGSNIGGDNAFKLFTSISGAAAPFATRTNSYYTTARNVKYKTTSHYFVRVYAPYVNYSNNPTFVSGSNNQIFDKCFVKEPQTYITSVGLYNNFNELIGIAKLSKPIKKTFDTDLLIKIRLNW